MQIRIHKVHLHKNATLCKNYIRKISLKILFLTTHSESPVFSIPCALHLNVELLDKNVPYAYVTKGIFVVVTLFLNNVFIYSVYE